MLCRIKPSLMSGVLRERAEAEEAMGEAAAQKGELLVELLEQQVLAQKE